jgi:hypothetical protein
MPLSTIVIVFGAWLVLLGLTVGIRLRTRRERRP